MQIKSDRRYSVDHLWLKAEKGNTARIGITDFAQEELGDIVYIELPGVGTELEVSDDCVVIESVKTAVNVKSPLSGTVIEVNDGLDDEPELLNYKPYGAGWMFIVEMADTGEIEDHLTSEEYRDKCEAGG